MSWPATDTLPDDGLTIPQTMPISVVLPAPFGPSSAKISPCSISRLMFLRAWKPDAYVLERLDTARTGGMGGCLAALGPAAQVYKYHSYSSALRIFLKRA